MLSAFVLLSLLQVLQGRNGRVGWRMLSLQPSVLITDLITIAQFSLLELSLSLYIRRDKHTFLLHSFVLFFFVAVLLPTFRFNYFITNFTVVTGVLSQQYVARKKLIMFNNSWLHSCSSPWSWLYKCFWCYFSVQILLFSVFFFPCWQCIGQNTRETDLFASLIKDVSKILKVCLGRSRFTCSFYAHCGI